MGTSAFQAGTVVEIQGKLLQLVRQIGNQTWQLEDLRTKRIQEYTVFQLQELYVAGQLIFARSTNIVTSASVGGASFRQLGEKQLEEAKIRRAYAMAVMEVPNSAEAMGQAIAEVWQRLRKPECAPHWTTVYRWKVKLQKAGKDILSLAKSSHLQGNRTRRYPQEVLDTVNTSIERCYLSLERKTIQDTLDDALATVLQENRLRPEALHLPLPTRRLVTTTIEAIPAFDRYSARHGRVAATKRFRAVLAHRTTAGPLERAEIDHTPLDLMVIDDDTLLPLGRPYLTACIDDNSRYPLGLHLGFEPPSYLTVARCLKHAFLPKTDLQGKYPSIKNAWHAYGVMRELVVDNGAEFHSTSLENACYSLGIEIHYSARKTPWFKGKIERFLGTLNRAVAHGNPGTTFSNIFDKEEYDPSKHAVIRLSKLREIINMWVVDVYAQQPHRALNAPPAVVWQSSIRPEDILLPDDPAQLDAILGRSEDRRLTHKGIELHGLLYNSPELTSLRRRLGDKLDVEVRIDDSDLGQIIVLSPDKTQMFKVPSLTPDYAMGLSAWQHRVCKKYAARQLEKYDSTSWLEAKAAISRLIDEEFMHKKQKSRSRIARFKENAQSLPLATRELQHSEPAPPLATSPAPKAEPLTPEDIAPVESSGRQAKRFKAVHRERMPSLISADQADMLEIQA